MAKVTKKSKSPSTSKGASSVSSRVASSSSKSESSSSKNNTLLLTTLILVVFQLIILFGLIFSFESKLGTAVDKIEIIESKVSSIDNFFASNVQGYGSGSPTNPTTVNNGAPLEVDIEGEPTKGSPDAPVTVVEFSDYECPFCGKWFTESYSLLKAEYIDTGKVKFVYKDFPLSFHPSAKLSAIAANCVLDQLGDDVYFNYHDILFENQRQFSSQAQLDQWNVDLKIWALELGADASSYDACTSDPAKSAEVDGDLNEGAALGVSGTPSFLINGNLIVGAQPYSVIKQAIEAELNK